MQNMKGLLAVTLSLAGLLAQSEPVPPKGAPESNEQAAPARQPAAKPAATKPAAAKPAALSLEARMALAKARELVKACAGKVGAERSRALEVAAAEYDRVAAEFAAEPRATATAAWHGGEVWRRHGSLPLAEKDYLQAAKADPVRYGQRGLLGAADMQRRQQRHEAAMATYARAEAVDPRTGHAHWARIRVARMLRDAKRLDDAIAKFQAALESAPHGLKQIGAADELAKAWILKGDLDNAGFVIDHARKLAEESAELDPIVLERLRRAFERMGSRKALQRARDRQSRAAKDAVQLDEHRRATGK